MNFFRMLTIEAGILFAAFVLAFFWFRSGHPLTIRLPWLDWLLAGNHRAVLFVIAIALLVRGLMLPFTGVPIPRINDEFSYLLMADTFSHQRITNPSPPAWEHFETFHVNFQPTYHSRYPVGQGLVLAFGQTLFQQPWIGVFLVTALMCGAICWALQAFLTPGWALLGGLLAVTRMALLCYWMNSYWGGSLAALGGALALGAVVRLFDPGKEKTEQNRLALASHFAIALLILATSRPYEGLAISLPMLGYFGFRVVRSEIPLTVRIRSMLLPVVAIGLAGLSFMGYYNIRTTGDLLNMPYALYERVYSPVPVFIGQAEKPAPAFRHSVFTEYYKGYQEDFQLTESASGVLELEALHFISNWWFYVGPALSLPVLLGLFSCCVHPRMRLAALSFLVTGIAVSFGIYWQPHYFAVATVAVYLFAVEGLRYLWDQETVAKRAFVVAVCCTVLIASMSKQTGSTDTYVHFTAGNARDSIARQLADKPGHHLVLVSYGPGHLPSDEMVHNGADLDAEKILWARTMGDTLDLELCKAYAGRTFWSVTSDDVHLDLHELSLCK